MSLRHYRWPDHYEFGHHLASIAPYTIHRKVLYDPRKNKLVFA